MGLCTAFPGAGPKTILTPWTPANDPEDPAYADYDLLTCSCTQVVNENSAMLRLDQRFSTRTTGFMRFSYDRSVDTQPLSAAATDLQQRVSTPVNGTLEALHVFTPNLVDEAKFGFNRATSNTYNNSDTGTIYQIAIATGPGPGFVTQNYSYNSVYADNTFSGIDNLTWVHSRQTIKAGGEFRHIQLNQEYGEHGKVTFSSVETLADNLVKRATLTGALPVNHLRKNDIFGYFQDELKLPAQFHAESGCALQRLSDLQRSEWQGQSVRFRHLRGSGFLRSGCQLRQPELRRFRPPRGSGMVGGQERKDGSSRRIWNLP